MSEHTTLWGHVILGIEVLVGFLLSHRFVSRKLKKITFEFNGKDRDEK